MTSEMFWRNLWCSKWLVLVNQRLLLHCLVLLWNQSVTLQSWDFTQVSEDAAKQSDWGSAAVGGRDQPAKPTLGWPQGNMSLLFFTLVVCTLISGAVCMSYTCVSVVYLSGGLQVARILFMTKNSIWFSLSQLCSSILSHLRGQYSTFYPCIIKNIYICLDQSSNQS